MTASVSDDDLTALFAPAAHQSNIALAVSGGGDSMALLHLAHRWARGRGVSLHALTVDHGLRPDSAAEAAGVAAFCAAHGIAHRILTWSGDGDGNLPDAARRGRYAAMADACTEAGATMLLTGHTLDDQAETVLMRLGRGSGVDGLAAMRAMTPLWGVQLFRPLLGLRREDLRDMLRGAGVAWVDDPTNEDRGYTRIRARDALAPPRATPRIVCCHGGCVRFRAPSTAPGARRWRLCCTAWGRAILAGRRCMDAESIRWTTVSLSSVSRMPAPPSPFPASARYGIIGSVSSTPPPPPIFTSRRRERQGCAI